MFLRTALDEAKTQLKRGPEEWSRLDLALDFDLVMTLVRAIDNAEVAARETTMALRC